MAESKGARAAADLGALLRARNTLIWVTTREEVRAEQGILQAAQVAQYEPRFWDCATGVTTFTGESVWPGEDAKDPAGVLQAIRSTRDRSLWVLRDLHLWLRDPTVLRAVRSLARTLPLAPRNEARAMIVLSPSGEVPPELAGHAIVVEWPLPDRSEVATILDSVLAALPEDMRASAAPNGTKDAAIDAAVGLSAEEVQSCYAKSLVQARRIDPAVVASEKKRVISREKVLEWYDPMPGGLDAVGGLEGLKAWLRARRSAFTPKARAFGLPAPKGILLVGIAGCGKSLMAKAVATAWGMPLLRLDMGALKAKYVGESEANIRRALRTAEAVAPCVVWLDEIEKALAGATQGAADGGTSADALGTLLSWMQERTGSVFVVATSNDVRALPPELLRKGRFDELFWVDLPTLDERAAILAATLNTSDRSLVAEDLQDVAAATDGFTGAEIAALVPDALYAAFADGARSLMKRDLIDAAARTTPLSKTAAEKIRDLREWAKTRCRPASITTTTKSAPGRALDL